MWAKNSSYITHIEHVPRKKIYELRIKNLLLNHDTSSILRTRLKIDSVFDAVCHMRRGGGGGGGGGAGGGGGGGGGELRQISSIAAVAQVLLSSPLSASLTHMTQ